MALTNGDFETGNLTGWVSGSSGDGTIVTEVSTTEKRTGTYALRMAVSGYSSAPSQTYVYQDFSSSFTNIRIYYKVTMWYSGVLRVGFQVYDSEDSPYYIYVLDITPTEAVDWTALILTKAGVNLPEGHYWGETTSVILRVSIWGA
jgi:hypothetical protein